MDKEAEASQPAPSVDTIQSIMSRHQMVTVLGLGTLQIVFSASLINFNKYLISSGIFPFPLQLVLLHTCTGFIFALLLKQVRPSMFPSLTDASSTLVLNRSLMLNRVLPVSVFFAFSLVLSNVAYMHLGLSFLQMLKQCNVALVYGGSVVVGLQILQMNRVGVVVFILCATTLNIRGELHFNLTGFFIQVVSQFCEVSKLLLQDLMLSAAGIRLDPMSYLLIVMPCCFCVLVSALACIFILSVKFGVHVLGGDFEIAGFTDIASAAPWLFANAIVAFLLNVTMTMFIKVTSAIGSVLAMLIKDIVVVIVSLLLFHDVVSPMQWGGFTLQLAGIFLWSMMQRFPKVYDEHGMVTGTLIVLQGEKSAKALA